jgi:hypothetical protein
VAKTYQTAIDEAREILQDTDTDDHRYADSAMLNILNRGLQELARIRPDAFWDTFVTDDIVVPEVLTADLGTTFPIPMQFYAPIVAFLVAWAEVLDDEFTVDGRANMLLNQFKTQVMSL